MSSDKQYMMLFFMFLFTFVNVHYNQSHKVERNQHVLETEVSHVQQIFHESWRLHSGERRNLIAEI